MFSNIFLLIDMNCSVCKKSQNRKLIIVSLNDVKFDVKYELSLLDNSFCLVIAKSMRYCHVESVQSNPSSDGLFPFSLLEILYQSGQRC